MRHEEQKQLFDANYRHATQLLIAFSEEYETAHEIDLEQASRMLVRVTDYLNLAIEGVENDENCRDVED